VKTCLKFVTSAIAGLLVGSISAGQQPATTAAAAPAISPSGQSTAQKSVETFLRHYYALGPEITITVGTPKEIGTSGLMETPVDVKTPEGSEKVNMFLTKDGRYLIRGEVSDLTSDPLAEARSKIITANSPALGNPNAPITLVEYSDFQCPVCRSLHDALRGLLPNYPQVKVVFKDFPLETLHPWARTAALAGRCAYQQDSKAFWKLYDLIYDNQELISAANAYDKMLDFAGQAGVNQGTFKACLSSPEAAQAIDASVANGNLLEVHSTPTVFVNGRRIVGADPHAVQQYIEYEIAQLNAGKK
jgi:protein-disulfide isomerase